MKDKEGTNLDIKQYEVDGILASLEEKLKI